MIHNGRLRIVPVGIITIPSDYLPSFLPNGQLNGQLNDQMPLPVSNNLPPGTIIHHRDGLIHRDGGPAITYPDGAEEWYERGRWLWTIPGEHPD